MNFDNEMLEVATLFFKGEEDCPFCTQKKHLQHIVEGMKIDTVHNSSKCLYNWIGLTACIDNAKNRMTPEELRIWVSTMSGKIIQDVNTFDWERLTRN